MLEEKIIVKPNFVDGGQYTLKEEDDHYIYIGRLSAEKGITTLLQTWRTLPDNFKLKVVGDGPLGETLQKEYKDLANISFLGRLYAKDAYDVLSKAKCLIFPSEWYETFGRVVIEAFSQSTPVIASRIGGIGEIVDENKNGYLFSPGNIVELKTKIQEMDENIKKRLQMGKNGRHKYEKYYSPQSNYEKMMEVFQIAIGRNDVSK